MKFDVEKRTVLYTRHGSHAYGLNIATSDEDFKGICVKPKEAYLGFCSSFEQKEHMGSKSDGVDSVIYSLDKFARLAADCNPSIIEILHVDQSCIVKQDEFGEELRSLKDEFISRKAKFTFMGYAEAQLKRIKTHRSWLLTPPTKEPERIDFGLDDTSKISASELGAFVAAEQQLIESVIQLPHHVLTIFTREKQYSSARQHYSQYIGWMKSRNPARAELEAKFGYDTKHGMHLIRLMRMANEILAIKKVVVKRPDRDELLAIRRGERSYDSLIEESEQLKAKCELLFETTSLPTDCNRIVLEKRIVSMVERYLTKHG